MCLFKHNENAYKEMAQYLDTKNRALLVLGTSGGKTTTALEYVYQNNGRALVLCPTNGIKIDWEAKDVCDVYTYQAFSFNDFYKTIDYSKYCVVILDESHHVGYDEKTDTGAKSWSKSVKWILDNNKCKVLGLTATNERTDGIDLAKTFFDGCTVYGLAVEDMIEQGILYPFSYVTAIYNYHDIVSKFTDLRDTEDKTTKDLLGQLDLSINNTKTVKTILNEYIEKQGIKKIKGIVFVSANSKKNEQNTLDEAKSIILDSFPHMKDKVRILYSNDSYMKEQGNACEENKIWFENSEEGIIITINQAGEGWHPKGINVLVMFRKTNSYLVFTQQLGRIMTLKTNNSVDPHAIVFDLVNNIENVECAITGPIEKEIEERPIYKIIRALEKINSNQIIIADETRDIVKCIKKIKEYISVTWSEEENNILKEYYPTEGYECYKRLSGRTKGAVQKQAAVLGIKALVNEWSEEEDNILREFYSVEGPDCYKRLQDRTREATGRRASVLNLKAPSSNWTEEEINILKEFFPIEGLECYKRLINRTKKAVGLQASSLGIKSFRGWTEKEIEILKQFYPLEGGECYKRLPGRTKEATRREAKVLKIRRSYQ